MAIPYELLVKEDLNLGYGTVSVTMPAGGTATGTKIGLHTFASTYNVMSFGAVGDGLADDTAAIQSALDTAHAIAVGAAVYFPPGIFKVTTLTWYPNVSLIGSGTVGITTSDTIGTILRASSAAVMIQQLPSSTTYQRGVIRDLTLDGNSVGTIGLDLKNLAWFQVQHVFVFNFVTIGIRLRGCLSCQFLQCQIRNCVIGVQGDQDATAANFVAFRDCQISSNTTYGLTWQNGALLQIVGCDFELNGTSGNASTGGIKLANMNVSGEGIACVIENCWVEANSGYAGIRIDPPTFASGCLHIIKGVQIFSGTRTYGLAIVGGATATQYLAMGVVCQNAGTADFYEGAANVTGNLFNCSGSTSSMAGSITTQLPKITTSTTFRLFGGDISTGASDSGGTGFKLLRVPNAVTIP